MYVCNHTKRWCFQGSDSSLDDCAYHLVCPCCTLCQVIWKSYPFLWLEFIHCVEYLVYVLQESRTLEMNNVQNGTWHGRGDTVCIGGFRNESKPLFELRPPSAVSIEPTDENRTKKSTDGSWKIGSSSEFIRSSRRWTQTGVGIDNYVVFKIIGRGRLSFQNVTVIVYVIFGRGIIFTKPHCSIVSLVLEICHQKSVLYSELWFNFTILQSHTKNKLKHFFRTKLILIKIN